MHILFFITSIIVWLPFFAQPLPQQIAEKRSIAIGVFLPMEGGKEEPQVSQLLQQQLVQKLNKDGFSASPTPLHAGQLSQLQNADLLIAGFYQRSKNGNLLVYGQIYDSKNGVMIDAYNEVSEFPELEDLNLPRDEMQQSDEEVSNSFSRKIALRVRLNPQIKEKSGNINRYVRANHLDEKKNLPVKKEDIKKSADEVFKLMEEIEVVSATKTKTTIREAPAAVYVITKEQIEERGYRTLVDALHDLPGFDFQHTYGIYPELFHQRGLVGENNRTNIYIDGIQNNNINENGVLAGSLRFPLANVERIEIVSGPASSLYGANAFNGIINIITKDGKGAAGNHVNVTHGYWENYSKNPGTAINFSARGFAGDDKDGIAYSVGGYYYNTVGANFGGISSMNTPGYNANDPYYYLQTQACGGACDITDAKGYWWSPTFNNSNEDTYNVTAKLSHNGFRFQTSNWQYLQGDGTFGNGNQQVDTLMRGLETGKTDSRNLARLYGVLLGVTGAEGLIGSRWDFKSNSLAVGYLHDFSKDFSLDSEASIRSSSIINSSRESYPNTPGLSAYYDSSQSTLAENYSRPDFAYTVEEKFQYAPSAKFSTIVGLVGKHFVAAKGYGSYERFTYNTYAAYIQQMIRPVDWVSLTLGYRYDETTTYGSAKTPRVSVVMTPIRNLTLKFLYSTGFREPSAKELFAQTPQRKRNPGLKPEILQAREVGIGYRFLRKYYASIQGYHNRITNLIMEVKTADATPIDGAAPTGGTWQQNQNLGQADIYGAEFESRAQILKSLQLSLNYTFLDGKYSKLPATLQTSPSTRGRLGDNSSDDLYMIIYEELTGDATTPSSGDIPNVSPHKVNFGITYYLTRDLSFYSALSYVDIRRTKATNPVKAVAGYNMVKVNIRWRNLFYKGLYVNFLMNNALNEQFFDPGIRSSSGGYYPTQHPLERRNVWLTLGYKF